MDSRAAQYQWVEGGSASLTMEEAKQDEERVMWLAYAAFHLGNYQQALDSYQSLLDKGSDDAMLHVYMGCCLERLGWHAEAEERALKGPACPLQNRLLFHLAHRLNDENKLMMHHQKLADTTLDQLSLASIHFLRNHFQEATDIYKRLLLENRDYTALNVYVALCYYKLDYYDVSLEILAAYLQAHPDSSVALNLKACNQFRLYDGKAAEAELAPLTKEAFTVDKIESKLVRHNMVVFQSGERALQILPPLVGVVPEARLNLVIYHMHMGEVQEAFELMKDIEPSLAAGVHPQGRHQPRHRPGDGLARAPQGRAAVLPAARRVGVRVRHHPRQAAVHGVVLLHPAPVRRRAHLPLLHRGLLPPDPTFLYNYAIARAAAGKYKEAEPALLALQSGASAEELSEGLHLPDVARALPRDERQGAAGVGDLPEDGGHAGVVRDVASSRERLLSCGRLPVRGEGVRHARAPRPEPRVLGRQARRVRRRLPDGDREQGAEGDVARGDRDAQVEPQPAGRVPHGCS